VEIKRDEKSLARYGKWKVGSIQLETPMLYMGYTLKSKPAPWKYCNIDGIMVSAFNILHSPSERKEIEWDGLDQYISKSFPKENQTSEVPIMLDSGGFSFLNLSRGKDSDETMKALWKYHSQYTDLISKAQPTIAVALDFPIDPRLHTAEIEKRLKFTAQSLQALMGSHVSNKVPIMPVVHPYKGSIKKFLELARPLLESAPLIGIGSLVPLITHRGGSRKDVISTVKELRELFADKLLHVFGIGGTTTMHTMLMLGADSLDTMAWRKRAAYGIIQLPGIGDRYLVKERKMYMAWKGIKIISEVEIRSFLDCDCDACRGRLDEILWKDLKNWVISRESQTRRKIERAFKRIRQGMTEESKLLKFENQKEILADLKHIETWMDVRKSDSTFLKKLIVEQEDFSDFLSNIKDKAKSGNKEAIEQYLWLVDKSFTWRAIHNLYTYGEEISKARKAIQGGSFTSFCKNRLEHSPFYKLVSSICK